MTGATAAIDRASERAEFASFYSFGGRMMIAALVLTAALCTMDRMVLSLVVDPVRQELGLSETQIGLLQGLSFSLMYSLAGIPLGLMADRVARGKLLAVAVLIWSVGTFLCGFASSFETFFVCRMLVGTGEAALWPVAVSLIGDLVPTRNRGNVIGWVIIGQLLGGSFSLIVGGRLLEHAAGGGFAHIALIGDIVPWRLLFMLYGLAGALAIILLMFGTEPKRTQAVAAGHPLSGLGAFFGFFRENWKSVGALYLLTAFVGAVQYSGAAWNMPLMLRRFDYGPQYIGLVMGIMMFIAGAAGSLAGGYASKKTGNSPVGRCNVLIVAYFICIVYGMVAFNPGFAVTVALCAIPAVLTAMAGVIKIVIMQDIVPPNMRGVATAINHLFASLLGASIGPLVVAMLTENVFKDDKMVGVSLGIVVGVSMIAAAAFCFVIKRQIILKYASANG